MLTPADHLESVIVMGRKIGKTVGWRWRKKTFQPPSFVVGSVELSWVDVLAHCALPQRCIECEFRGAEGWIG